MTKRGTEAVAVQSPSVSYGGTGEGRVISRAQSDTGLGLLEVVVAMALLTLLAIAALPLVAAALSQASRNATVTSATELVEQQLSAARSYSTCAALDGYANPAITPAPPVDAGRGVQLQPVRSVTCPSSYPGTAVFTASVTGGGKTLATATTRIFVSAP